MKLTINGEMKNFNQTNSGFQLPDLLEKIGYQPQLVVVELNGEIINPNNWGKYTLKDGDSLEIVTIVGGGS